ncbi:MAG: hypothetical protein DWP95_02955 [Proteobacteria bacterium]|nr:MAG: hypothetical protein DWP95_02955 [Pseudomonadota bacterium]
MANQSKSMVFGFVIIAAIIFAVALGYRMTQVSDKPVSTSTPEPVTIDKATDSEPEIKVVSYDKNKIDMSERPSPEEQAEIAARSPHFMKFAMRYKTGEEAVKALPQYIENDQFEEAEFLIKFIETQFPDTPIPDEFADL